MANDSGGEITKLLLSLRQGDGNAESQLAHLIYDDLRRIARGRLRLERAGHSLQPSDLVNEVYMQLVGQKDKDWKNRSHFFAVAAQLMRRTLIDHARAVRAKKRGGDQARPVPLEVEIHAELCDIDQVLSVDAALTKLEQIDPRQSRVVELRYFGGLTEDEVAEVLAVSCRTVKRDWNMARVFLREQMSAPPPAESRAP